MSVEREVANHYTTGALLDRIRTGLAAMGADRDRPGIDDLKTIDEFHIGGAQATRDLIAQLELGPNTRLLDIGSGIGGPARFIASVTGAHVTGIDLTEEFVATANALTAMTGLGERNVFVQGSALEMPFGADSFDTATLIHVGMNLPDKPRLFAEAARVLRPGGIFAVYDVMRTGEGEIAYPVPWAMTPETSFPGTLADYREAAEAAGFSIAAERVRRQFALDFFAEMSARIAAAGGPPPLSLNLVMGPTAPVKVANMITNIEAGRIAPVEMICRLPA